ncbi:HNH endonuclease [Lutibacter sp. B2]|nr:HNH endonuclease [Lutibacter sp. B2]
MCIEDVQNNYFLGRLINEENGLYYYRTSGINASKGSLILFQFDNMIIASARLLGIEKYDVSVDDPYHGAFKFDVHSIKIFQPITLAEINRIDNNITKFSQVKQEIKPQFMDAIDDLIQSKQVTIIPDELSKQHHEKFIEGSKKQIIVNAYERNYKARQLCIDYYGSTCVVCGFDFAKFYGDEFEGKIHVHHIKPLSEINESYEVDPINDLRPICPNCHLVLHSKINGELYDIDELKSKIK